MSQRLSRRSLSLGTPSQCSVPPATLCFDWLSRSERSDVTVYVTVYSHTRQGTGLRLRSEAAAAAGVFRLSESFGSRSYSALGIAEKWVEIGHMRQAGIMN